MSKFKPFGRRRYDRLLRDWRRQNAKALVVLVFGTLGILAFVTLVLVGLGPHTPFMWWALGAGQVAIVAVFAHLIHVLFLGYDREAVNQLRGAWGEDYTRSELQSAKRKGHVWGWVDSIQLQAGDIDHLVVTRRGGLVAIDTKWRSQSNDIIEMATSARRAGMRAEAIARTVLASERKVRHRAKANPLPVVPVVVVWGAAQRDVPAGYRSEGVEFIPGRQLVSWLAALDAQPVAKGAARDLLSRLREFRENSWDANTGA